MKLKQEPEDFVVEERARIDVAEGGRYALYQLRKRGLGTLEALRAVRRAWRIPSRVVGFGGLKDRHAATAQWVTIPDGPRKDLERPAFSLVYEGACEVPMSRTLLEGNRFRVRVRDLSRDEADAVAARMQRVAREGLPAYFDDQRFGSLRGGGGFAFLHLARGDAEAALKAVIASPSPQDRGAMRARKAAVRDHWADPRGAVERLVGSPMRAPVLHLVRRPGDYEGAFATLEREERRLLASAYASSVWNRAVADRLRETLPAGEREEHAGTAGPRVFPTRDGALTPFEDDVLPLPAPRARAEDPAWHAALERALAADGLAFGDLVLPRRLGMDLRATRRPIVFRPEDVEIGTPARDDANPGRTSLEIAFSLARGMYATLVLEHATANHGEGRP